MKIKPIKTEKDYEGALARIERLWDAAPDSPKGDELSVLVILVESYEAEKHRILPPDPIEAIKFRRDQLGLKKTDLVRFQGITGRAFSTQGWRLLTGPSNGR